MIGKSNAASPLYMGSNSRSELMREVNRFKHAVGKSKHDDTYDFLKSSAMLHQLLAAIRSAEMDCVDPEDIRRLVSPVRDILATSELANRMQKWPRGYPGDFETIELLCDGANGLNKSSTQVLDNILLYSPTAQQHRNKIVWQGHQLLSTVQTTPGAHLLSVACGGSRDLLTIVPYLSGHNFNLCLNDVDEDALKLSHQRLKNVTPKLDIIQGDVFQSVRKLAKYGPFDVIVAGGLFDYLNERQAIWLLSHLRDLLVPGGKLCFTNIAKGIPYNGWLDYLANWKLISRSEDDIVQVLKKAGATAYDEINIEKDTTGHTLLIRYTNMCVPKISILEEDPKGYVISGDEAKNMTREEKWQLLSPFIRKYGREAISYATLQQGMEYFVHKLGYIAFVTVQHPLLSPRPKRIVLCDPLCAVENYEIVIKSFLEKNPNVAFGVISETCATILRGMGFRSNCIGCETVLPIPTYNTSGNWKDLDLIKRAKNEVRRKGITIREVDFETMDRKKLEAVSQKWLTQKKISDREIWIYARKPIFDLEDDVRKFVAIESNGDFAGFVFYDPIYNNGKVVGYSANTPRTNEKEYVHLTTAIHMAAIETFRAEGKEELNLCLSPFVKLDLGIYNDDVFFKGFLECTAKYGEGIYNFSGLSFHKSKYRGFEKPIYFATKSRMASNELYLSFRSAGISKSYWSTMGQLLSGIIKYHFGKFYKMKKNAGSRSAERKDLVILAKG